MLFAVCRNSADLESYEMEIFTKYLQKTVATYQILRGMINKTQEILRMWSASLNKK